jgi:adenine deaminase
MSGVSSKLARNLLEVAAGRKEPDFVLSGNVFSVFTGECFEADVAVYSGYIAGVGEYSNADVYETECILPGFIDAHLHIESTLLHPVELAKTILKHGTTAIIADPHEIANVCGKQGIKFMIDATSNLPVDFYFTASSSVPAVEGLESFAFRLEVGDIKEVLEYERVIGLAEVMNYHSVVAGDVSTTSKINIAKEMGLPVDGHCPGLSGKALNAYIVAGISTDHESTSLGEVMEKLRKGMKIMLREGSVAKNLKELAKAVSRYTVSNLMIVTDDLLPEDLLKGHMDERLRRAVRYGIKAEDAVKMVTINPATHYSLNCGAVAPGFAADLVSVNGFDEFKVELVVKNGKVVWDGEYRCKFPEIQKSKMPVVVSNSFKMHEITIDDIKIPAEGSVCRLIKPVKGQILTEIGEYEPILKDCFAYPDPESGISKVVVADRHGAGKFIGKAFVEFKMDGGAMASSVSHDSHNCICVGVDDRDMVIAMNAVRDMGGGFAVSYRGELKTLPLPIAGLMSDLSFEEVVRRLNSINKLLRKMGVVAEHPFIEISFFALPVIPKLRITDFGLVDVENMRLVDLWIE